MAKDRDHWREDREFCYCDAYDYPHRAFSGACKGEATTTDLIQELAETTLNFRPCPLCKQDHIQLKLIELDKPKRMAFFKATHYAICPETNEPIFCIPRQRR